MGGGGILFGGGAKRFEPLLGAKKRPFILSDNSHYSSKGCSKGGVGQKEFNTTITIISGSVAYQSAVNLHIYPIMSGSVQHCNNG